MRCTAGKQDGTVTGRYAGFCDHPLPSMLMLAPAVVVVQLTVLRLHQTGVPASP